MAIKKPKVPVEPHSQPFDFKNDVTWRIFRIMSEFTEGIEFISTIKRPVTFFGSTRIKESSRYYQEARKLAKKLGLAGFTIVTGGGPGIMEAANRGGYEAKADSVGLNIQLPNEQRTNRYVKRSMAFDYFFSRKSIMTMSAQAYVFFPGGYGTLDELFSILTLISTKKIESRPVILYGKDYWRKLNYFINVNLLKRHQTISETDAVLYSLVDDVDEATKIVKRSKKRLYSFM